MCLLPLSPLSDGGISLRERGALRIRGTTLLTRLISRFHSTTLLSFLLSHSISQSEVDTNFMCLHMVSIFSFLCSPTPSSFWFCPISHPFLQSCLSPHVTLLLMLLFGHSNPTSSIPAILVLVSDLTTIYFFLKKLSCLSKWPVWTFSIFLSFFQDILFGLLCLYSW